MLYQVAPYGLGVYVAATVISAVLNGFVKRALLRSDDRRWRAVAESTSRGPWRMISIIVRGGFVGSSDPELVRWSRRARLAYGVWLFCVLSLFLLMLVSWAQEPS